MDFDKIPVQILNLNNGDCLIFRLPKEAFAELGPGLITGAEHLESEFQRFFELKNKDIKVKALPLSVELAIISPVD